METVKPTTTANVPAQPELAFPAIGMLQTPPKFGALDQRPQVMSIYQSGMTLRDYFAAQALTMLVNWNEGGYYITAFEKLSQRAYELADAMLAERSKVQP